MDAKNKAKGEKNAELHNDPKADQEEKDANQDAIPDSALDRNELEDLI